jgi:hypothetical protein
VEVSPSAMAVSPCCGEPDVATWGWAYWLGG